MEKKSPEGLIISGYVNVPGRESRPVITPRGKAVEVIEQRAFQRAIDRAEKIDLRLDHGKDIASTSDGTLEVSEDAVGLRAEAFVTDKETIEAAKSGKLKGWSFGMRQVKDEFEERAGRLPLRVIKDLNMYEVSLVLKKTPFYSSTSMEFRADNLEEEVEFRAFETDIQMTDSADGDKPKVDYTEYENKIKNVKGALQYVKT